MDPVELLKRPEGKTLEFKRELSAPEGALKTIIAFANTAGGTLLVGVEDRSGHVRGISEPLDLEERLANLISDQVAPRLMPEIEILPWRRTQVLAVRVYPSPSRPHYLERAGPDGGVYVRVGSTNRQADRELVRTVRANVTIDWTLRENVRAQLRVLVKRILRRYGYPPDKQEKATETVLEQAALLSPEWAAA
jgi:predicted HTH transcriptional regulator